MLNSTKERSVPARSSSLRIHSVSSSDLPSADDGSKTPELAVELQHLHELKRQVAAQEQKLAALRADGASCDSTLVCEAESEASKALVFAKEKELALALMKVSDLTRQLEQLRGGQAVAGCGTRRSMIDGPIISNVAVAHKPIVKPTVAPPPPPVSGAAMITRSLSMDPRCTSVAVLPSSAVSSSSSSVVMPPSKAKSQPKNEDIRKCVRNNNNNTVNSNNNNENNAPYVKLVQTVAALARTNRRSEQTTQKRSESFHRAGGGDQKPSNIDKNTIKIEIVTTDANKLLTSNSIVHNVLLGRNEASSVGCFGLESCVNKAGASAVLRQNVEDSSALPEEISSSPLDSLKFYSSSVEDRSADSVSVSAEPAQNHPVAGDTEPVVGRVSSTAQMMSCFAPRPYGMTSGNFTVQRSAFPDDVTSTANQLNSSPSSGSSTTMPLTTVVSQHALTVGSGSVTPTSSSVTKPNHSGVAAISRTSAVTATTGASSGVSVTASVGLTSTTSSGVIVSKTTGPVVKSVMTSVNGASGATSVSKTSPPIASTLMKSLASGSTTNSKAPVQDTVVGTLSASSAAVSSGKSTSSSLSVLTNAKVTSVSLPVQSSTSACVTVSASPGLLSSSVTAVHPVASVKTDFVSVQSHSTTISTTASGKTENSVVSSAVAATEKSAGNSGTHLVVYSTTRAAVTQPSLMRASASSLSTSNHDATISPSGKISAAPSAGAQLSAVTSVLSDKKASASTTSAVDRNKSTDSKNATRLQTHSAVKKDDSAISDDLCDEEALTSLQASPSAPLTSMSSSSKSTVISSPYADSVASEDLSCKTSETSESSPVEKTIDTSSDSVSTALSVLLKSASSSPNTTAAGATSDTPTSPKSSYRYGARGTVSGIYRRKLGMSSLDQYTRNLDQLYGGGGVDFFSTMSASVDAISSPTTSRPASVGSAPMSSSCVFSSPTLLIGETSPEVQFSSQRKGLMRPTAPPPPPPSSISSGFEKVESDGSNLLATLDGVKTGDQERPRSTAPNIARRAFLYGDVSSPTGDEFKLFGDTSVHTVGAAEHPRDSAKISNHSAGYDPSSSVSTLYIDDEEWHGQLQRGVTSLRQSIGRLRTKRKSNEKRSKSVTFDPCSMLLSATITGELDIITASAPKILATEVSGEIGLCAFKNAIGSRQYDAIRRLVDVGFDVNAADSDGWTVLHYAASANDVEMVRLLVASGSCVLAKTGNDHETAEMKCNRNGPGYDECVRYLREVSTKLGIDNDGVVYASSAYKATSGDELSFCKGSRLKILRKATNSDFEWWWASCDGLEGYVPQYLLAMYSPARQTSTIPA